MTGVGSTSRTAVPYASRPGDTRCGPRPPLAASHAGQETRLWRGTGTWTISLPASPCPLSLVPLGGQLRVLRRESVSRISDTAQPQSPGFPPLPPRPALPCPALPCPALAPQERPSTHSQEPRLGAWLARIPGPALCGAAPCGRVRSPLSGEVQNRKWRLLKGARIVYAQKAPYVPLWNYASPKPRLPLNFG